jgi:hypothetical protein
MLDPIYFETLRKICDRLNNRPLNWAVTGSLGMALQGMDIRVHDIDIQTDKYGAYQIGELFSEYVVEPVHFLVSERMRSHFGILDFDGIKIDIMGDVQKLLEDQAWEEPVNIELYKRWINFDHFLVPVLSLEYEYEAYRKMGRTGRAEKIKNWLDADLLSGSEAG